MKTVNNRGLTLLEILLGIAITSVVFVLLLSALRLGQRSQEKGESRQELAQRMRVLSDRLAWLLRGAYPYVVRTADETKLFFSGSESGVGFVTTSVDSYSDGPEDVAGLKWVGINVDEEGLKISEKVYFLDEEDAVASESLLDPSVRKIRFEYLGPGEGEEEAWFNEWPGQEREHLPSAVRITLVLEHEGAEVALPPVTAAIRTGTVIGGEKAEEGGEEFP